MGRSLKELTQIHESVEESRPWVRERVAEIDSAFTKRIAHKEIKRIINAFVDDINAHKGTKSKLDEIVIVDNHAELYVECQKRGMKETNGICTEIFGEVEKFPLFAIAHIIQANAIKKGKDGKEVPIDNKLDQVLYIPDMMVEEFRPSFGTFTRKPEWEKHEHMQTAINNEIRENSNRENSNINVMPMYSLLFLPLVFEICEKFCLKEFETALSEGPVSRKTMEDLSKLHMVAIDLRKKTAVVAEKPVAIRFNEQWQMHSADSPAIEYKKYNVYIINGIQVPEWLVTTPAEELANDPEKILGISNIDVRRVALQKVGPENLWKKYGKVEDEQVIDRNGKKIHYKLVNMEKVYNGRAPYLLMENPSVPDVWHMEGVSQACKTVQEAINWRKTGNDEDIKKEWDPITVT